MNGNDECSVKEELMDTTAGDLEKEDLEKLENEIDYKCQLYVRFPCVLPPVEDIKALNPNILHVFARRRKKPKFCYLAFSSPEATQQASEELSKVQYNNLGLLDVRPKEHHRILPRSTGDPGDKKRWLIVYGIPPTESDTEVLQAFSQFGCTHAHVHHQDVNKTLKKGSARLVFRTANDSEAFVQDKNLHNYKGSELLVNFLKTGPSKSARKRLRRKEKQSMIMSL